MEGGTSQSGHVVLCTNVEDDSCLGHWLNTTKRFPVNLMDIAGQVLIVAYDMLDPYVKLEREGEHVNLTGYLGDLWTIMEKALGFSSVYFRVNGQTARLMLQRGLADVYLQPTVITTDEDDLFDHTQPVVTHWYQLFVRKGAPEVSADSYIRVLSPQMWALTCAVMVLLGLMLRVMVWTRSALGMSPGVEPTTASLGSCFMSVLGGLSSQGWQESPSCLSVRVTVVTTLFFGYLLSNAYAAVLISYLASGYHTAPFASLDEVSQKGTHALCVRNESYAYVSLKRRGERWNRVLNVGVCRDASQSEQLATALCDYNTAVLEIPSVMAAALDARPECQGDVLRIKGRVQRATASLLLRRGFRYTPVINDIITRCRTTGVLDRLEKLYLDGLAVQRAGGLAGQDGYNSNAVTSSVQVSLDHVRWVLAVYALFQVVPLLMLTGESVLAWKAKIHARRRRTKEVLRRTKEAPFGTTRGLRSGRTAPLTATLGWRP